MAHIASDKQVETRDACSTIPSSRQSTARAGVAVFSSLVASNIQDSASQRSSEAFHVPTIDRSSRDSMPAIGLRRRTLHSSVLGRIEDFSAPGDCPAPSGHSAEYQLVLPYAGAFEWHVAAKTAFLDTTRVLFVNAGEDYADAHIAGGGHDSIILTPRLSLLQELCGHTVPSRHPAFQRVSKPTRPRMNIRTHRLLRLEASFKDTLASDELMIALLGEALGQTQKVVRDSPLRIVDLAKQVLHERVDKPISLDEIAHAVQVSGAYLTDAFTRSEGMPLCRYHMRLRLNRALVDLPSCADLTKLALDLGFSSHAHFSTAFKSLFGVSPSAFRAESGKSPRCPSGQDLRLVGAPA